MWVVFQVSSTSVSVLYWYKTLIFIHYTFGWTSFLAPPAGEWGNFCLTWQSLWSFLQPCVKVFIILIGCHTQQFTVSSLVQTPMCDDNTWLLTTYLPAVHLFVTGGWGGLNAVKMTLIFFWKKNALRARCCPYPLIPAVSNLGAECFLALCSALLFYCRSVFQIMEPLFSWITLLIFYTVVLRLDIYACCLGSWGCSELLQQLNCVFFLPWISGFLKDYVNWRYQNDCTGTNIRVDLSRCQLWLSSHSIIKYNYSKW